MGGGIHEIYWYLVQRRRFKVQAAATLVGPHLVLVS